MFRTVSLTAVCLILASANSAVAQKKPFKNKIALAAKKSYEEAIAKAKKEYTEKLDIAIKESGGAGDIDEANRLVAEKKAIDSKLSPIDMATKRLEGTRWGNKGVTGHSFYPDGKMIFGTGAGAYSGVWIMSDPQTILCQSSASSAIAVFKFDEKLTSARVYRFAKSKGKPGSTKKLR